MRLTEFWARMDRQFGSAYSRSWAKDMAVPELGSRTVEQALAEGEDAKTVWRAVCAHLEQPAH